MIRRNWRVQYDRQTVGLFRSYEQARKVWEEGYERGATTYQLHLRRNGRWVEYGTGWAAGKIDAQQLAGLGIPLNEKILIENPTL